jgi:murein DD-endopeptidase MepM/ murein hydrolase activator NlpD
MKYPMHSKMNSKMHSTMHSNARLPRVLPALPMLFASLGLLVAANAAAAVPYAPAGGASLTLKVVPGDTVQSLLRSHEISAAAAAAAATALNRQTDLRSIQAGDRLRLRMETMPGTRPRLLSLRLETGSRGVYRVVAAGSDFRAGPPLAPPQWTSQRRSGLTGRPLASALRRDGLPAAIAAQLETALAEDPGLPRHLPDGAPFTVVYKTAASGVSGAAQAFAPRLRFATLRIDGRTYRLYRYVSQNGAVAYVDGKGRGRLPVRLLRPLPGAPVTSPWGWRIHPILKVRRFHKGVDFGAPEGTPVHAAGDGYVEDIGRRGNYGLYIRIRDSARLETAYAHLSGFAAGLHRGSLVHGGDVIARVGETGWATGPHLYFEVLIDGQQVDPLQPQLQMPIRVDPAVLQRLRRGARRLDAELSPLATCRNYVELRCSASDLLIGNVLADESPAAAPVATQG